MENKKAIIRVRRGIGETRYCACDNAGNPIRGFNKLSEVRRHWKREIRLGQVELARELDKLPDMAEVDEVRRLLDAILKSYARKH